MNKQLVIAGGGFAGVYTARYLRRRLPRDWEIILFSRENHFIFTPLLGDVVGSAINPLHVVWPIRQMARHVTCRTATLTAIDWDRSLVRYATSAGGQAEQPFDQLVLAGGSIVNLDIIPGMAAHGWPLKTMGDALLLRNHLIGLLERAEVEPDPVRKRRLLSIVVVGGGFSGVEVTGEAYDLLHASTRFYSTIKPSDIHVTLLEGRERILPDLPESLSAFATRKMSRHGIMIRPGAVAHSVTENGIALKSGETIAAATVICTIGTTASPFIASSGLTLLRNRIKTGSDMRVEGKENVWALGDCAAVPSPIDQALAAPTAQVAVRQAKQLAGNIVLHLAGRPTQPFHYKPIGMLASIGNHKAVGSVFGLKVSGLFAWFLWRGIYLGKMPTLARKIQIAFDWAWQLVFPRDIVQLDLGTTERLQRAHYEAGHYVFHKGDPGDKFYIIQSGRAGVYLDEGRPPVTHLRAGDHFGEGALLRAMPRSASVRAEEPLDVIVVDPKSFAQLSKHLDVFRIAIERSLQTRLSVTAFLSQAQDDPRLNTQPVKTVMSSPLVTLSLRLPLDEALRRAQELGKGAYPVVNDAGRMLGIVTRTDFYRAVQKMLPPATPLADIMRQPVITVRESDSLATALLVFLREPIKRLVVVADDAPDRPVGMLTPFDLKKSP